jgi:uncharacterized membrane protein
MGLLRDSWDTGDAVSRVFVAGVLAKGINGVAEVVGGAVLFLVSRDLLIGLLGGVAEWMMSDDPRNVIGRWILDWSKGSDLSEASISFVATYLLLHGIAKLVLVGALLRGRLWAYPLSIAVLVGFIGYQLYDIATEGPSFGMIALTLFDIVLTWLAWREWQHHKESGLFDQTATSPGGLDYLTGTTEPDGA